MALTWQYTGSRVDVTDGAREVCSLPTVIGKNTTPEDISPTGGGAASLIHQASRTLINAEIQTLPSALVDIVPATPVGMLRLNVSGNLILSFLSGYTNVAGDNGGITALFVNQFAIGQLANGVQFATAANTIFQLVPDGQVYQSADAEVIAGVATVAKILPLNITSDSALAIAIDNYDVTYSINQGNFTGGDPGNTLICTVLFLVIENATGKYLTAVESGWDETTRTFL